MRLNQKRALFSAIAPIVGFLVLTMWYVALNIFIPKLVNQPSGTYPPGGVYQGWIDGVMLVAGGVGTLFIPLGIIAALVFWWLDRQDAKP